MGPPTSPVFGFRSPSNSGFAPLLISGCNSSPLPDASTRALIWASSVDAGAWLICGRDGNFEGVEDVLAGSDGLGELNAPVELRCRRSNSSCSFGGRRGGDGLVAKVVRGRDWEKKRRAGRR